MKKTMLAILSITLILSFILCSCSSSTPTPAPTTASPKVPPPATSSAPAPAPSTSAAANPAPAKIIALKYAEGNPRNGWYGQHSMLPWVDAMEKATNGQIKIDVYDNETLLKSPAIWNGVVLPVSPISDGRLTSYCRGNSRSAILSRCLYYP